MERKKKHGDRRDWPRITSSDYVQMKISEDDFDGTITLYCMNAVREPLYVPICGQTVCIADAGYSWLYQIPTQGLHVVTAMFDTKGHVIQWYIDICSETGIGEDQVPWFDDLYLDVIVLPSGEFELLDADELQDALDTNVIDQALFDLAWNEANRVQALLATDKFELLKRTSHHRQRLLQQM